MMSAFVLPEAAGGWVSNVKHLNGLPGLHIEKEMSLKLSSSKACGSFSEAWKYPYCLGT